MGKSTALKHLSLSWAEGCGENLKQFDYVFHIALKDVKKTDRLESIIVRQHKGLSGNGVQPSEIKHLLERDAKGKVLLLLDGYDEYRRGINAHIDKVITKDLYRNCSIVLTSRETEELPAVREYMDSEAEILAFDDPKMKEYISKYLGSTEKSNDLIKAVLGAANSISSSNGTGSSVASSNSAGEFSGDSRLDIQFYDASILEFLRKPFLVHMVCVLYCRHSSLPKTKTGIFDALVNRCIDLDAIRRRGRKNVDNMSEILVKLGKLTMKGLLEEQPRQTFSKVLKLVKNKYIFLVGGVKHNSPKQSVVYPNQHKNLIISG